MIKLKAFICCLLFVLQSFSFTILHQREDPVHWSYRTKKIDQNKYEIHITASIDASWHIYAENQPKEAVAIPTKIKFNFNPLVKTIEKLKEIGKMEKQEVKEAGIVQYAYSDSVEFVQVISVKPNIRTNISGKITYQACTDEMCLPVKTVLFSLSLN